MHSGIATKKLAHVGAVPRWTLLIRVCGENTSTRPTHTISTWVQKSITASTRFTPIDSSTPRMLIAASTKIATMPAITSPGGCSSAGQNSPPM